MSPLGRVSRMISTARNVAEVARLGGLRTDDESSPYTVVTEQLNYRLRHYFDGSAGAGLGSSGVAPGFTGRPSGPTSRIRGWLRNGCWPNSTSFSDRFP